MPIVEDTYSTENKEEAEYQDWLDEVAESRLHKDNARIACDKLDVMTRHGRNRLTQGGWEYFIDVWSPDFEMLLCDEFKGKLHYVIETDPWDSA